MKMIHQQTFIKLLLIWLKLNRKEAKTINLGLFYGMGKAKLQNELGVSKEKADELFNQYHEKVPFVKELMTGVMEVAQNKGKIKNIIR
jgi:DNA polymerase I